MIRIIWLYYIYFKCETSWKAEERKNTVLIFINEIKGYVVVRKSLMSAECQYGAILQNFVFCQCNQMSVTSNFSFVTIPKAQLILNWTAQVMLLTPQHLLVVKPENTTNCALKGIKNQTSSVLSSEKSLEVMDFWCFICVSVIRHCSPYIHTTCYCRGTYTYLWVTFLIWPMSYEYFCNPLKQDKHGYGDKCFPLLLTVNTVLESAPPMSCSVSHRSVHFDLANFSFVQTLFSSKEIWRHCSE